MNGLGIKPDEFEALPALDWIVVGGESGPRSRPFDIQWARVVVRECRAAGVPVFVKQVGAGTSMRTHIGRGGHVRDGERYVLVRDRKGGDPSEWPEDVRVREWPEVRDVP